MSDDLVARLRSIVIFWTKGRHTSAFIKQTIAEAAIRIEQLEAERDTLAEMVRLFDPWVTLEVGGYGPYLAQRKPARGEHITLTPDQAERFRAVLDPEDGDTDE